MIFLQVALISVLIALLRRGRILRLADIDIRRLWLLVAPAALTLAGSMIRNHASEDVWIPVTAWLNILINATFLVFFWSNVRLPGIKWFVMGWTVNIIPIAANGGKMPVSQWASDIAGSGRIDPNMVQHVLMTPHSRFRFLADIIPVPHPVTPQVASPGDLLMLVGLFLLIQLSMCPVKQRNGGPSVGG